MDEAMNLPLESLKGIGPKTAESFARLRIHTLGDLLQHYPKAYDVAPPPTPLDQVRTGDSVTVALRILRLEWHRRKGNLDILRFLAADQTGQARLLFFRRPYLAKSLRPGSQIWLRGKAAEDGRGGLCFEQAQIFTRQEYEKRQGLAYPLYPLTLGLRHGQLQKAIRSLFSGGYLPKEHYPAPLLERQGLLSLERAYKGIHFPSMEGGGDWQAHCQKSTERLVFDEFFDFFLSMGSGLSDPVRQPNPFGPAGQPLAPGGPERILAGLPYSLTPGQEKAWTDIQSDFSSPYAANRLLQGDVGCGKTLVALLALAYCGDRGFQGALMVPTEVLARQHYATALELEASHPGLFEPVLLVGSMSAREKKEARKRIQTTARLAIGTHALLQESVEFSRLGLVVTDEQHRFGVGQREALFAKGDQPHILVMSATPIPRSLAMALYGNMPVSRIEGMPADRLPIKNCLLPSTSRPSAYKFIQNQVSQGRQAYVICPMIDEEDGAEMENVCHYSAKLEALWQGKPSVGLLHGKMPAREKQARMEAFVRGEVDVLVSTTVIEVGVNVPNATVILIEDAQRFGLSALHQLRGRVGRGREQSYCILVDSSKEGASRERLEVVAASNDGFYLAAKDMELRGPGELAGFRQSGALSFSLADLAVHGHLLERAKEEAERILALDPALELQEHRNLKKHMFGKMAKSVDFRTV